MNTLQLRTNSIMIHFKLVGGSNMKTYIGDVDRKNSNTIDVTPIPTVSQTKYEIAAKFNLPLRNLDAPKKIPVIRMRGGAELALNTKR